MIVAIASNPSDFVGFALAHLDTFA